MPRTHSRTIAAALLVVLSLHPTTAVAFSPSTPTELPPTVSLLPPVVAGQQFRCPPSVAMHWTWPETAAVRPDSSRWVCISSKTDLADPDYYVSFPESLVTLPARYQWSPWRAWDAADGSGVRAEIHDMKRIGESPGSGFYLFAVQVKDQTGSITEGFDGKTPQRNNVAFLRVSGVPGSILSLSEPSLGRGQFSGIAQEVSITAAAGQDLEFHWAGDASSYGGVTEAYRFGWDLANPDLEEGWGPWGPEQSAPGRSFSGGTHTFHVEARDDLGLVARAGLLIELVPMDMNRDLLWVDDTDHLIDAATEAAEDSRWLDVLHQVALANQLTFDPQIDVYDVRQHVDTPPAADLLFDYKVVVWSTRSGAGGTSGLRQEARFTDPLPQRNWNTGRGFNDLNVYVANGGRLWINGFRPEMQLWPTERQAGHEGDPVNVTNWDDPLEPHSETDSVGTTSLVYRMGIEMFDVGSSLERRPTQSCLGFGPATPDVPELQVDPETWGQGGSDGRVNISIYDMPTALVSQVPPLVPPTGKVQALYLYRSNVPENPSQGLVYPATADNQPALLVSKVTAEALHSSMAICGFEPYLLTEASHQQLLTHLLVHEMGMGPTPVLQARLTAQVLVGAVRIDWQMPETRRSIAFRLQAQALGAEWDVPYEALDRHAYTAMDESSHLVPGGTVVYSLFLRDEVSGWVSVGEITVDLPLPSHTAQLLPPRPNPFNPSTKISFVLPEQQHLRLRIFRFDGSAVCTLVDALRPAGPGAVVWQGTDDTGRSVASGLYIVRMESGEVLLSRRLALLP